MNVDALRALENAVEAGAIKDDFMPWIDPMDRTRGILPYRFCNVPAAYNGSFDAAMALLASVLPEWKLDQLHQYPAGHWLAGIYQFKEDWPKWVEYPSHSARADNPARAILLAVIRALIAQAEAKEAGE